MGSAACRTAKTSPTPSEHDHHGRDTHANLGLTRYSLYVMDYGAPIGYRLTLRHPEQIAGLIIQNGNAYDEGLLTFWDPIKKYWNDKTPENRAALTFMVTPETTKWQYQNGVSDVSHLDPTTWTLDQVLLDRAGNGDIQLDMLLDYGTNVPLYPQFPGVLPQVSAASPDCLGKERLHLSSRGCSPIQAGSSECGNASVGHGPFCPRNPRRRDCFSH